MCMKLNVWCSPGHLFYVDFREQPKRGEGEFLSRAKQDREYSSGIDHMLGHKMSLNKFIEFILSIFPQS